jgi:hypothetical protein
LLLGKSLSATKTAAEAGRKSAEATAQMVQTARTQERAYLFVEVGLDAIVGDIESKAHIFVSNSGKTPAILTTFNCTI